MAYPVNEITTIEEADDILTEAAEQRAELEYRQTQLQRLQTMGSGRSAELGNELASAQLEYDNLTTLLAGMSAGPTKTRNLREHKRLEYRLLVLGQQQTSGDNGVVTRFKRAYELKCIALELTENASFAAEVTARRTTFSAN